MTHLTWSLSTASEAGAALGRIGAGCTRSRISLGTCRIKTAARHSWPAAARAQPVASAHTLVLPGCVSLDIAVSPACTMRRSDLARPAGLAAAPRRAVNAAACLLLGPASQPSLDALQGPAVSRAHPASDGGHSASPAILSIACLHERVACECRAAAAPSAMCTQ